MQNEKRIQTKLNPRYKDELFTPVGLAGERVR